MSFVVISVFLALMFQTVWDRSVPDQRGAHCTCFKGETEAMDLFRMSEKYALSPTQSTFSLTCLASFASITAGSNEVIGNNVLRTETVVSG